MKLFPQLALVSAIAISGNAMAMQALDDTALSASTGQEGITVAIAPAGGVIKIDQIVVRDGDGFTTASGAVAGDAGFGLTGTAGSITLGTAATTAGQDFEIKTTGIDLVIDADGNGTSPVLNVGVKLNAAKIITGDIGVAVGGTSVSRQATTVTVLDSITLDLGTTTLNVQLGNETQGSMIDVKATVANGLKISDFALRDAGGTVKDGKIAIGTITVTDAANATKLTINADIDVNAAGLVITTNGGPMDVVLDDVRLGASTKGATAGTFAAGSVASLGDVGLFGLNMTGTTITVAGHP